MALNSPSFWHTFEPMAQEKLEIEPLRGPVDADVVLPGSKSYTNRALIIAALADGKSEISRALRSEDTHLMAEALKALNVDIRAEGATFRVEGTGGYFPASRADLFVGNSGTTARFLTAALGLGQGTYTLDGVPRMRQRPIQDLLDALSTLGVAVQSKAGNGCLPVVVHASGIEGGRTSVVGSRSSQYLTAILLAAPYAANDVEIQVKGNLNSRPYVDMTLEIMHAFGTRVVNDNYERFQVASGQCYAPGRYTVEPDASNASYFFAAAALTGGRVQVLGLRKSSAQGDVEFVRILEKMGCRVSYTHAGIQVCGPTQLSGTEVDLNLMPDTVPALCAIAPFASGPVSIHNVANLRIKETDRIAALSAELQKLGLRVDVRPDGLTVYPADRIRPAEVDTYNDHRMAMSMALVGLAAPGVVIRDPACVKKTFPGYFRVLDTLRNGAGGARAVRNKA